ncbi:DUF1127 domain-containing protein [Pelagibius sp.]|uniref:DUF1127 domain-containing protein n=1 Tax=Pelagibius sp. TaxID=1931238 RepID=UPI00260ACE37|nr:DUF1127 domain-containing protein [Pelagibius sp.]
MNTTQFDSIQDPIVRAQIMRSQAAAEHIVNAVSAIGGAFRAVAGNVNKYLAYRRIYETLNAMSDRELDDIGLCRGDIGAVARGHDPRPQREAYLQAMLAQQSARTQSFAASDDDGANDNRTSVAA